MRTIMFSKHLQELSVVEAGKAIKQLGFAGVELTVRPGGHLVPADVEERLPQAVAALGALGLSVPAIVVEVYNRRQPEAIAVCRAAAAVGATVLRAASHRYRQFGNLRQEIAEARADAAELEALGREFGLQVCVHIHSGAMLSAQAGTLLDIIGHTDPRYVGVSFDLAHLTVEGGRDGWRQAIDLLHDRIGILAVKSFGWSSEPDPATGGTRWSSKIVPLDQGTARWQEAFSLLRQVGWDADGQALVSLHSEYQGPDAWRQLTVSQLLDQTAADLAWLRRQAATE